MTVTIDDAMDPLSVAITDLMRIVRGIYDPDTTYPPIGGGTKTVHFVSGEGPAWDPMASRIGEVEGDACSPFVWVRLVSRYRTTTFPEAETTVNCGGIPVVALEVGVGRCVNIDAEVDWGVIATEAEWGFDDAFRLDRIGCVMKGEYQNRAQIAVDPILPEGPEGGGVVWSTTIYVGLIS